MNCLFWNVNKLKINDYLLDLIVENGLQLLILAEYKDNWKDLIRELGKMKIIFYHHHKIGCERIDIFSIFPPSQIKDLNEEWHYTIKEISHSTLGTINLACVHFQSKMHSNDLDQLQEASHLIKDILDVEDTTNENTIIVGDFNMNPFSMGILSSSGIHSYPTKFEARKISRTISKRDYKMFYNPMWKFMGNSSDPLGTYYYSSSHSYQLYWNVFDQIIYRPGLIEYIPDENIKILTKTNKNKFVNRNGKPNISDHLPLYFEII